MLEALGFAKDECLAGDCEHAKRRVKEMASRVRNHHYKIELPAGFGDKLLEVDAWLAGREPQPQ
jgi:hypothetical protein